MGEQVDKLKIEVAKIKESLNLVIRALNDNELYIKSSIPEIEENTPEEPENE